MRKSYWILKDKKPVHVSNVIEWGEFFEKSDRIVAKTSIGDVNVSTVFLGIDHNFLADGEPLLFETMIFGGEHNEDQWRYSTWEEAEKGHADAVLLVKNTIQ